MLQLFYLYLIFKTNHRHDTFLINYEKKKNCENSFSMKIIEIIDLLILD